MAEGDPPLTFTDLDALPVRRLAGVGDKREKALAQAEIESVLDLLTHYPRRYLDRTKEAQIDELEEGEEGMVLVSVLKVSSRRMGNRRTMVEAVVTDGTGRLSLTFFNQPWRERQLTEGMEAIVFGKLGSYRGKKQMANPVVDLVGDGVERKTGKILPVYPQSEKSGISTWDLGRLVLNALEKASPRGFADPVPAAVLDRFELCDRATAFREIHAPDNLGQVARARKRLVFDELLRIQVKLVQRKRLLESTQRGVAHRVGDQSNGSLVADFHERLPFPLTNAQRRAIDEITHDLGQVAPMHRLLQGDVGAGKTIVAVSALLVAVQGGHQGALMAPTEVLAEQHHLGVSEMLDGMIVRDDSNMFGERPLAVELLANRTSAPERKRILAGLADGSVDLIIGTHALIQDAVEFSSLGVVVIDEQHRFGVEQRAALRDKNSDDTHPDVLVMTATPIPRTAAMTVYGDLDVSVLDELPPGRTPIETTWVEEDESGVWAHVRDSVTEGRQAYVVCPLIEDSDTIEVRSAEATFEELAYGELAEQRLALLHGRMSSAEKEATMAQFRRGELDVLVATTVIEVGVDVPNATTMVILDAARFGIAQLHQLRGRVGRGQHASHCFLVGVATTPDGEARLEALVATTDGFELAEIDLELRGEGQIMGERQKGRNDLKLASLRRDKPWVERAREVAYELVDPDPTLTRHRDLAAEIELLLGEDQADFLLKS